MTEKRVILYFLSFLLYFKYVKHVEVSISENTAHQMEKSPLEINGEGEVERGALKSGDFGFARALQVCHGVFRGSCRKKVGKSLARKEQRVLECVFLRKPLPFGQI